MGTYKSYGVTKAIHDEETRAILHTESWTMNESGWRWLILTIVIAGLVFLGTSVLWAEEEAPKVDFGIGAGGDWEVTCVVPPYNRHDWMPYNRWADEDGDCMSTRHEVLLRDNLGEIELTGDGCRVKKGKWWGRYSEKFYTDPRDLDIDHLVALKEAHMSGGWAWPPEKKQAYANELGNPNHLIAVRDKLNQDKKAKDPSEWMPKVSQLQRCKYILDRWEVKLLWGLTFSAPEVMAMMKEYAKCRPAGGGSQ